jgi:membrane-bound metal-dependent hydrolase YbcI (DUF457 family)
VLNIKFFLLPYTEYRSCMITRHHITLAALCSLILIAAGFYTSLLSASIFIAGTVLGSVVPDIHMKKPSRLRLLTGAYYLTRISETTCLPALKILYQRVLHIPIGDRDKHLAHSLPGIALFFTTMAAIAITAGSFAGVPASDLTAFLTGFTLGLILHLVADMCTKKGVMPIYPFGGMQVAGTIRPCNTGDPRILCYHTGLSLALAGVMILSREIANPGTFVKDGALTVIAISSVAMLYCSRTRIMWGSVPAGPAPSPAESFME